MPPSNHSIPGRRGRQGRAQNGDQVGTEDDGQWLDARSRWEISRLAPQCLPRIEPRCKTANPALLAQPGTSQSSTSLDAGRSSTVREDPLRLLARLRAVLRAERRRGLQGHWSYDLARHTQLLALYQKLVLRHLRQRS